MNRVLDIYNNLYSGGVLYYYIINHSNVYVDINKQYTMNIVFEIRLPLKSYFSFRVLKNTTRIIALKTFMYLSHLKISSDQYIIK